MACSTVGPVSVRTLAVTVSTIGGSVLGALAGAVCGITLGVVLGGLCGAWSAVGPVEPTKDDH